MSRITLFLSLDKHHIPVSPPFFTHGFLNFIFFGSVEIPDLTSIPEIHDEPVFDGYRKGGCRSGGDQLEDFLKEIFSSLPIPMGTANIPKNVLKNDDFYRAYFFFKKGTQEQFLLKISRYTTKYPSFSHSQFT